MDQLTVSYYVAAERSKRLTQQKTTLILDRMIKANDGGERTATRCL